MTDRIELLDPTAAPRVVARPLAARPGELAGGSIGFLTNKKANADRLLAQLEALLRDRIGPFAAVRTAKSAPLPAPEEVILQLSRCMAVVSAVAD